MRVEEQVKALIADAAAFAVWIINPVAVQKHAERFGRAVQPVLRPHFPAMRDEPGNVVRAAVNRQPAKPIFAPENRVRPAQADQHLRELEQRGVRRAPIEPRNVVVLTIGVIVAALRPPPFIAREQHRHALREQQRHEEIFLLLASQRQHVRARRFAFRAAIPRAVMAFAVAVVFAVGGVLLVIVRDEIAQREAVVRRDEVDAGGRMAAVMLIEIGTAGEARGEFRERGIHAAPIIARRVAVFAVPFRPARRKIADLIAAVADIPRLGNQLDAGNERVLVDNIEKRAEPVNRVKLPRKGGGEVESEAVHMHVLNPIAQAVHNQAQHVRVHHVQRVARAGEIHVIAALVVNKPVIGRIVNAAKAEHGAEMIPLGGVIIDDIQNHLDSGAVQGFHHFLELRDLLAADAERGKARVRREKADGVVAPIIAQAAILQMAVRDRVMHRHQFNGGHTEPLEIANDGGMRQPRIRSAQARRHGRMAAGEAFDVRFVDDGFMKWNVGRLIAAPVEKRVNDDGFGDVWRAVAVVARKIGARMAERVAERGVVPLNRARNRFRIRVNQQFRRIEAMPLFRLIRAVNAIAVAQPRSRLREIDMPDVIRAFRDGNSGDFLRAVAIIEQAEFHAARMFGKEGEIHAPAIPCRAERRRFSRPRFPRALFHKIPPFWASETCEKIEKMTMLLHIRCGVSARKSRKTTTRRENFLARLALLNSIFYFSVAPRYVAGIRPTRDIARGYLIKIGFFQKWHEELDKFQ